jgi:serine/threonine-protein kinase
MAGLRSRNPEDTTSGETRLERVHTGSAPKAGPPASDGYRAGDTIGGKYCLTSLLGQGGMGAVWLARNTMLDVDVAVKLIRHEKATPAASARLLKEAQLTGRLSHPSIVRIFDFGETTAGDPFIVMELLQGETLAQLIERKGRLPPVRAVQVLLPVVSALQAAHKKGIVHRDLKPDNVFLEEQPTGITPKVVDFGIAKLQLEDEDRSLTQTGAVLGSPDYMSPEQARGRTNIDERTDVWGLSVVLYEAVTGIAPFQGVNYNALLSAIIEDDPTPITELGVRDSELWAILRRGLAKKPEERWHTAQELGRTLVDWLRTQEVTTDITGATLSDDWGSERRPLSEPLAALALRGAGIAERPTEPAPASDDLAAHAIPPPPLLPAEELGLATPSTVDAPGLEAAELGSTAEAAARFAPIRRATLGTVAAGVVLLLALGWAGLSAMHPRLLRSGPTAQASRAAIAIASATAPAEPAPEASEAEAAALHTIEPPAASAASAETPVDAGTPSKARWAGKHRKPGTMPLPAKPNF